jgi:hypothetical protein
MAYTFEEQEELAYTIRSFAMPECEQERLVECIIAGQLTDADRQVILSGLETLALSLRDTMEKDGERIENLIVWSSMKVVAHAKELLNREAAES